MRVSQKAIPSSYSAENVLKHASVKKGLYRNTLSQEFSKLAGLRFAKKELHSRSLSGNTSKISKISLRNLIRNSFLITLEPVECKPTTPNKREVIKYIKETLFKIFRNIPFLGNFKLFPKNFLPRKSFLGV